LRVTLANVFDVVRDALEDEKLSIENRVNVLNSFQANVSRQAGVIRGLVNKLTGSVRNLLGQFSNKNGYSQAELTAVATTAVETSLSNEAGIAGIETTGQTRPEDDFAAQTQEAINRFQNSLLVDPLNVFVLPRIIYDNMSDQNVQRATALNEALETVGQAKLMHDVIPPDYYDALALETLETAQPQLLEVLRNLRIACGAIASGTDPTQLIETVENDFEAVIRFIGRESVYDSSQFSPTEYLSLIRRMQDAADSIEETTQVLETSKANIVDYQANFLSNFDNSFSECGTLDTASVTIQAVSDRIDALVLESTQNAESLSVEATREIILQLTTALAQIQEYVRKTQTIEDVLTTEVSDERTLFEDSQAAVVAVPTLSPTLPDEIRQFARLLEQRLTSPTVSAEVPARFSSLATEIPAEFVKSEDLQVAMNNYSIDVTEEDKSLVVDSLSDIEDLGLNRMFEAILTGDLTIGFDTSTSRASKVGYAIQEVALAIEGAISGVSLALGGCKVSNRFSARQLSTMMAELQDSLQVRVFAQLSFREALKRRLRILQDKSLKNVCRHIEELAGITAAEGCE
jgi:hypothetical protein